MTTFTMVQGAPRTNPPAALPRLLDELRRSAQQRGHTARTAEAFAEWALRFIRFHGRRHPRDARYGGMLNCWGTKNSAGPPDTRGRPSFSAYGLSR